MLSHVCRAACSSLFGAWVIVAMSCGTRARSPTGSASEAQPKTELAASASAEEVSPPPLRARDRRVTAWLLELAKEAAESEPESPASSVDLWDHVHGATPEFCRRITGYEQPFESCGLYPAALGTAGVLAIVESCGAHLCDVKYWVFARDDLTWVSEKTYGGLDLEVSPDHELLLIGRLMPTDDLPDGQLPPIGPDGPMWTYELGTEFIDLQSRNRVLDVPCGSMVISPERRYYVCRDVAGNVLRMPIDLEKGDKPKRVVTAELPEGDTIKLGGSFDDYPGPVRFSTDGTLEYDLFLNSGDTLTRTVPWSE